jgi:hypothetical protein
MNLWRNAYLIKTILFFFSAMLFNPVYGQQGASVNLGSTSASAETLVGQSNLPVTYVSATEAQQFVRQLEGKGYVVREGTLAQLDELTKTADQETQEADQETDDVEEKAINNECEEKTHKNNTDDQLDEQAVTKPKDQVDSKPGTTESKEPATLKDKKCKAEKTAEDEVPQGNVEPDVAPEPIPPHEYHPEPEVRGSVGLHLNASGGSGSGSNRDFAKVFFIFVGFVVVAAFVVYVGKYIADMAAGKDKKLWRELIFNSTFLSTKSGRSGQFMGAKLATGFVSDELIQLALVGEVGSTSLDLVLNENANLVPLNFSATYWMLGATARLHLSAALKNASYLYLEFMGGTTTNSATDIIGAARMGANFGFNNNWRLGASLGAQYIGLNKDQGFANDGKNYWITYGVEIGARF